MTEKSLDTRIGLSTNLKCVVGYVFHYQHCDILTSDKELDPPSSCYLFLKGCTLCLQVSSVAIQDVGVLCFYVYVLEEVIPHEGVVALRVISGKSYARFYDSFLCKITAFKFSSNV